MIARAALPEDTHCGSEGDVLVIALARFCGQLGPSIVYVTQPLSVGRPLAISHQKSVRPHAPNALGEQGCSRSICPVDSALDFDYEKHSPWDDSPRTRTRLVSTSSGSTAVSSSSEFVSAHGEQPACLSGSHSSAISQTSESPRTSCQFSPKVPTRCVFLPVPPGNCERERDDTSTRPLCRKASPRSTHKSNGSFCPTACAPRVSDDIDCLACGPHLVPPGSSGVYSAFTSCVSAFPSLETDFASLPTFCKASECFQPSNAVLLVSPYRRMIPDQGSVVLASSRKPVCLHSYALLKVACFRALSSETTLTENPGNILFSVAPHRVAVENRKNTTSSTAQYNSAANSTEPSHSQLNQSAFTVDCRAGAINSLHRTYPGKRPVFAKSPSSMELLVANKEHDCLSPIAKSHSYLSRAPRFTGSSLSSLPADLQTSAYCISRCFKLADTSSRGKVRSFALLALSSSKHRLFSHYEYISAQLSCISNQLVALADANKEKSTVDVFSDCASIQSPPDLFLRARGSKSEVKEQSLTEILGSETIFVSLHLHFAQIIRQIIGHNERYSPPTCHPKKFSVDYPSVSLPTYRKYSTGSTISLPSNHVGFVTSPIYGKYVRKTSEYHANNCTDPANVYALKALVQAMPQTESLLLLTQLFCGDQVILRGPEKHTLCLLKPLQSLLPRNCTKYALSASYSQSLDCNILVLSGCAKTSVPVKVLRNASKGFIILDCDADGRPTFSIADRNSKFEDHVIAKIAVEVLNVLLFVRADAISQALQVIQRRWLAVAGQLDSLSRHNLDKLQLLHMSTRLLLSSPLSGSSCLNDGGYSRPLSTSIISKISKALANKFDDEAILDGSSFSSLMDFTVLCYLQRSFSELSPEK